MPSPRDASSFGRTSCALLAALAASGAALDAAHARLISIRAISGQGTEHSYALPSADGVNIDQDNEVILVRSANHIYAFALACPHENTALRWRPQDKRFQCPRHESKYQPDGTFLNGRATRTWTGLPCAGMGQQVILGEFGQAVPLGSAENRLGIGRDHALKASPTVLGPDHASGPHPPPRSQSKDVMSGATSTQPVGVRRT